MKKSKKITKSSVYRTGSRAYPTIIKDISIKFDQFTEIVENLNIGDCTTESRKLNLGKLLKKLEKNCNYFFKSIHSSIFQIKQLGIIFMKAVYG